MIFLPQPPECWDFRCVPPHTKKRIQRMLRAL
jgi:hypothetical protein